MLGLDEVPPGFAVVGVVGEDGFPSVGVGGVTSVVGASTRFGGVAGIWVMILLGAVDRREVVELVASPVCMEGGDAYRGSSRTFVSRFFPPNNEPSAPLEAGRGTWALVSVLGNVDLFVGVNASFSFPTGFGETLRLLPGVISTVVECRRETSGADVTESGGVASVDSTESIVEEAIKGEESVRSPAWDWWGEIPGLFFAGELTSRLVGTCKPIAEACRQSRCTSE